MRNSKQMVIVLAILALAGLLACEASVSRGDRDGTGNDGIIGSDGGDAGDTSNTGDGINPGDGIVGVDTALPPGLEGLVGIRIEPVDANLIVTPLAAATQRYTVYGTFSNKPEADVTSHVNLHLLNPSLGLFTGGDFQSVTTHGGRTMVQGSVGPLSAETSLTLRFVHDAKGPETGNPMPPDPSVHFDGGTADPGLAPSLVYPNDGVMLPPNVAQLEIHWRPPAGADLFELAFVAPTLELRLFVRCTDPTNGGCIHKLEPDAYRWVANSTGGLGPIDLTVRAANETGGYGASDVFSVEFAAEPVEGGVYYWTTSQNSAIMRFDFGDPEPNPEVFVTGNDDRLDACVGCHALSRDGKKMVMSKGGQNDGRIVFLDDVSRPDVFTLNVMDGGDASQLIQFASWNPDGTRFAAVYGDTGDVAARQRIHFHDGVTGLRQGEAIDLPFEASHIEWSPDGATLAMSRVGVHQTSQRPRNCGIEIMRGGFGAWGEPETVVPIVPGANRFNPSFAPDNTFMLFSEAICPNGDINDWDCDGDSDVYAKTWAVRPEANGTPVLMARASGPGIEDGGQTNLSDTFPRFSPYAKKQGTGRLMWATISSRRHFGLRDPQDRQLLWMFAMDPDRIVDGQDGSYPAFYVPYQDFDTSNHIAQWTAGVVRGIP